MVEQARFLANPADNAALFGTFVSIADGALDIVRFRLRNYGGPTRPFQIRAVPDRAGSFPSGEYVSLEWPDGNGQCDLATEVMPSPFVSQASFSALGGRSMES